MIKLYGIPNTCRKNIISDFIKTLQVSSKVIHCKKHLAVIASLGNEAWTVIKSSLLPSSNLAAGATAEPLQT